MRPHLTPEATSRIIQWAITIEGYRKAAFLRLVEPLVQLALGPLDEEYPQKQSMSSVTSQEENDHRRLSFLPDYVRNVSVYHETSMSFATLIVLCFLLCCLMLVFLSCFYHNQKTSPMFISPRRHRLPKLVPPPLPVKNTFSWVKVILLMSDEEIIHRTGYDALVFLRFHRLALRCIVKMSVFSILVLLPLNFTGNEHKRNVNEGLLFTDFMRFTMANVTAGSPRLWVHCFAAYLLTGIVVRELLVEYNAYNNIRHRYLLSREFHLRTVMVTNIPRHLRAPSKITTYFKNVYPDAVKSVNMCQNLVQLERLIAKRTQILTAIERELLILCREEKRNLMMKAGAINRARYNIGLIPKKLAVLFGCYEGAQERLAWLYSKLEELNEAVQKEQSRRKRIMNVMNNLKSAQGNGDIDYALAVSAEQQIDSPPTEVQNNAKRRNKEQDSNFGLHNGSNNDSPEDKNGKDKDISSFFWAKTAIKRYSQDLKERKFLGTLRPTVLAYNEESFDPKRGFIESHLNEVTDKCFVIMRTFTASTIALQSMHSSKPGSMEVTSAPEPRDVLWENIYVSKGAKKTRTLIADLLVLFIISFYIIPVTIISLLVSESALVSYSPRIAQLDKASALFSSALALVQPLCLVSIQQLLPPIFIFIGKCEGIISFSEVQMKSFSRYFMFQVLNIFLVTAVAGSIFDTLAIIIENPETMLLMLGNSLPRMSSFFITYVTMKTFLGVGFELVRSASMLQSMLRLIFFPLSTLRQKRLTRCGCRAIDDPGPFAVHKILAQDMLVVVISVVFTVVAPIVLFPSALFFMCGRILWTHHHLYVFESAFETGGLFFPKVFRRFIFGLIVAQATITGQFILKEAPYEAYATIVLMFMTYFFLRSTRARYDHTTSILPLEVATCMDITVNQEDEARKRRLEEQQLETSSELNDPWDLAYVQPALRANPKARPEQPFPPGQLGKVESFFQRNSDMDQHGTVKLNRLGHTDRALIDDYWEEQIEKCGNQNIVNVLIGEDCGALRIGATHKQVRKSPKVNDTTNEVIGEVEVIPDKGYMV